MIKNRGILYVFIAIVFTSCIKDNLSNISNEIHLKPGYAIPIGSAEASFSDFIDETWEPVSLVPEQLDTIAGFFFNDVLYEVPIDLSYRMVLPFSFSSSGNADTIISSLMIRTNLRNGIPAKLVLQAYFIDAANNIIDSLYDAGPLTIETADVDSDGKVTNSFELNKYDINFSKEAIERLMEVKQVIINGELIITQIGDIYPQHYPDQSFWIQLAALINLDLEL